MQKMDINNKVDVTEISTSFLCVLCTNLMYLKDAEGMANNHVETCQMESSLI